MKILGGQFKGKKLFLPKNNKTRPLKNIVKESIFNLLEHSKKFNTQIKDSTILDLFAGTGSFGIECLSREAEKVIFFENYPEAIDILIKNLSLLKKKLKFKIFNDDCIKYLHSNLKLNLSFDIIFIDPPFREVKVDLIFEAIIKRKLLKKNGVIIIHRHKKDNLNLSCDLNILDKKCYGLSNIYFIN
jgi:16S rRNA (guanine966-N2)-methyltransferase